MMFSENRYPLFGIMLYHSRNAFLLRDPQLRSSRAHARFRQPEFTAHDIGPLDQRHALVKRDPPRQTLAAEAAVGADDELLLRDVFQRLADQRRNVLRGLDHRVAVVDDADGDLLVGLDVLEQPEILPIRAGTFDRQYIAVELQQVRQSTFVARHLPMHALLIGIAPAGMHPDLRVDAGQLAIELLGEELEIGIAAVRLLGAHVLARLLHLDQRAAGTCAP